MSLLEIMRTCPGSIPRLLCIISTSIRTPSQSNNINDGSIPRSWKQLNQLIDSDLVREEQHPDWVANIVHVLKKNEKIRIYIDYRDLNAACPKDEFSLPITDVIVDTLKKTRFLTGLNNF